MTDGVDPFKFLFVEPWLIWIAICSICLPAYGWLFVLAKAALARKDLSFIWFIVSSLCTFCWAVVERFSIHGSDITSAALMFVIFGLIAACGTGGTTASLLAKGIGFLMRRNAVRVLGCGYHAAEAVQAFVGAKSMPEEMTNAELKAFLSLLLTGWILAPIFFLVAIRN